MEKYESYKSTDLPWLERIPSHWEIKKNKNVFVESKELVGDKSSDYTLLSLSLQGIVPRDVESGKGKFPKSFETYKVVKSGDMAFCLFDMDETPRTVGLSNHDGMLTGAYDIFHVQGINPRFLAYYYIALDDMKALRYYYSGLRKTINSNTFLNIKLPVPPEQEQKQIVRYLDWKIACEKRMKTSEKKKVSLLRELLDSNFNKAICGSEKLIKLKHLFELVYVPVEIHEDEVYQKAGMYNRGRGIFLREAVSGDAMGDSKFQKIMRNCIMLSGQFAWEGAVYVTTASDEMAVASHRYYLLKPTQNDISPEYIYAYLSSEKGVIEMNRCSHGAAGRNKPLNINELLSIDIPLPRDMNVVKDIDKAVHNLMLFQADIKEKIKLIEELRIRLVTDAVTGKIDIRDIDIPNYEFLDEDADFDSDSDDDTEDTEEQED